MVSKEQQHQEDWLSSVQEITSRWMCIESLSFDSVRNQHPRKETEKNEEGELQINNRNPAKTLPNKKSRRPSFKQNTPNGDSSGHRPGIIP